MYLLLLCYFQSSTLISHATAAALLNCGAVDYCLHILKSLLDHWKETEVDEVRLLQLCFHGREREGVREGE